MIELAKTFIRSRNEESKQRNARRVGFGGDAQGSVYHRQFHPSRWHHCALDGDKLDAIAAHPEVCLSAVTQCKPTVGPKDGSFTLQYRSAIAFGRAELVTNEDEKIQALRIISERFLPGHMNAFEEAVTRSLHRTAVVRITLASAPTGKRKQYDKNGEEMKYGRME